MGFLKKKNEEGRVLQISVDKLLPSPDQPRERFEDAPLASLAESIRRYGLLQPISVRDAKDGYHIIAGERRLRAARMAGLSHVPCLVYAVEGEDGAMLTLMENLLREDLNMFETATAIDRLCREYALTQDEVAERLAVSQSYVANKLRLLRLSPALREKILSSGLTERHARALLRLPDEMRETLAQRMITRRANVEQAERMVEEALVAVRAEKASVSRRPRGALKDLRLFYNSVDRSVDLLRRCGLRVDSRREEADGETRLIICIAKSG